MSRGVLDVEAPSLPVGWVYAADGAVRDVDA